MHIPTTKPSLDLTILSQDCSSSNNSMAPDLSFDEIRNKQSCYNPRHNFMTRTRLMYLEARQQSGHSFHKQKDISTLNTTFLEDLHSTKIDSLTKVQYTPTIRPYSNQIANGPLVSRDLTNTKNVSLPIPLHLRVTMIQSIYQYFPRYFYDSSPTMHPCIPEVLDHSTVLSISTKTKYESITNISTRMRKTHNKENAPNKHGCIFTKPIHHHLSYQYKLCDHRIIYPHQDTPPIKNNSHSLDLNSYS